ncbi:MAG: hypothetical protein NDJ89_11110 [Oligoflexia bacterium]|nr:hypothetical protein [Oligoflexia bacterium]
MRFRRLSSFGSSAFLFFSVLTLDGCLDLSLIRSREGSFNTELAPFASVKVIDPAGTGGGPRFGMRSGGVYYFSASDGVSGSELWRTDGTAEGTFQVKDIVPGASGSGPGDFVDVNGTLFFRADDGISGDELWKSDGTAAGTVLIKDIRSGSLSAVSPGGLIAGPGGVLLFGAFDGFDAGRELWRSDGTEAGTFILKDINPGGMNSSPIGFFSFGGAVYFRAVGVTGSELWKSDGTEAGTILVKDLYPGGGSGTPSIFFSGDYLLLLADDGVNGAELWRSDGTEAGTLFLKDLNPGPTGSSAGTARRVGDQVFFQANGGATGLELWKTDGTSEGTALVKDINPGAGHSSVRMAADVNGTLFFIANDGVHGFELWKSNGTEVGTVLVKDIVPGAGNGVREPLFGLEPSFAVMNGIYYFVADDGIHGEEIWRSDGTEAGTYLVQDFNPGSESSSPVLLEVHGGSLMFSAYRAGVGSGLWSLPP